MGFDLSGLNAKSKSGEYFRNSCWGWRPLWSFVVDHCFDILSVEDADQGTWNNGHEITIEKAQKIAKRLEKLLKDKSVQKYATKYVADLKKLPLEKCKWCKGTGKRKDIKVENGCNVCLGKGKVKSWSCS